MGWPWRRRRARHAAVPAPRPASWAQTALPPEAAAAVAAVVEAPSPFPVEPTGHAVKLGFLDGSELALPAHDESARALQAVAELLVQDPRTSADK